MNKYPAIIMGLCAFLFTSGAAPARLEETLILPSQPPTPGSTFAILLTGDGGWAELVRTVSAGLTNAGFPTVGWNSRTYYWTRRTPEEAASDLARLIGRFRKEWQRPRVVLIGYSMGADVLPFLVSRLSPSEREAIELIVLLGPGHTIDFEFHVRNYFGESASKTALPVPAEIEKLKGLPLLVLYAKNDKESCGPNLPRDLGEIQSVPGNHHFGGHYVQLTRMILDSLEKHEGKAVPTGAASSPP